MDVMRNRPKRHGEKKRQNGHGREGWIDASPTLQCDLLVQHVPGTKTIEKKKKIKVQMRENPAKELEMKK